MASDVISERTLTVEEAIEFAPFDKPAFPSHVPFVYRMTPGCLELVKFPVIVDPPRTLPELHLSSTPCACGARTVYCAEDHASICVRCGMPYRS